MHRKRELTLLQIVCWHDWIINTKTSSSQELIGGVSVIHYGTWLYIAKAYVCCSFLYVKIVGTLQMEICSGIHILCSQDIVTKNQSHIIISPRSARARIWPGKYSNKIKIDLSSENNFFVAFSLCFDSPKKIHHKNSAYFICFWNAGIRNSHSQTYL